MIQGCSTFIHVGEFHVDGDEKSISTVLGSCVAVCLYNKTLRIGGMNHYLLPMWNGNGLQTPKFGNISVPKLIEAMMQRGSLPYQLEAKIFGGASMNLGKTAANMMIGEKNIIVAREILNQYDIPIVAEDVGGHYGRKIQLDCGQGNVLMKYVK